MTEWQFSRQFRNTDEEMDRGIVICNTESGSTISDITFTNEIRPGRQHPSRRCGNPDDISDGGDALEYYYPKKGKPSVCHSKDARPGAFGVDSTSDTTATKIQKDPTDNNEEPTNPMLVIPDAMLVQEENYNNEKDASLSRQSGLSDASPLNIGVLDVVAENSKHTDVTTGSSTGSRSQNSTEKGSSADTIVLKKRWLLILALVVLLLVGVAVASMTYYIVTSNASGTGNKKSRPLPRKKMATTVVGAERTKMVRERVAAVAATTAEC